MSEIAEGLVEAALPPRDDGNTYRWRMTIAAMVLAEGAMLVLFVALAFGWLQPIGVTGFARMSDLEQHQQQLDALKKANQEALASITQSNRNVMETLLGSQIDELRGKQCSAAKGGQMELAKSYATQFQQKMVDFYSIMGRDHRLPGCDEF